MLKRVISNDRVTVLKARGKRALADVNLLLLLQNDVNLLTMLDDVT